VKPAAIVFTWILALSLSVAATHAATSTTTASQLTKRFKQSTGEKLVVNKQRSLPGSYRAYDLGVQSIARKARWGTFTVYLVTASDTDAEVNRLLSNTHTGMLGRPGPGNIYWEPGSTLHGDKYWMAKRRYGQNVVLTWVGATPAKKTDASFKRLHAALTFATRD
jgi:hypothetical protein